MKKILIDTDPGMDDTLAIILAIKSRAVQLLGISSVAGNYPIEVTTRNALKTVELLKRTDIPVARGMQKPLARPLAKDPFSHGSDGQAETHLPEPTTKPSGKHGVDQIIDMVRANPGEVTVITLGPLTNLAMAFMKEPDIVPLVKEVVAIAGSFGLNKYAFANATGDTPQSEWNVFVDPEAARLVFESGVPVRAVGLDVATHFDINFTEEQLATLKASARPEANIVEKMVRFVQGRGFESYCVLIDSMAVAGRGRDQGRADPGADGGRFPPPSRLGPPARDRGRLERRLSALPRPGDDPGAGVSDGPRDRRKDLCRRPGQDPRRLSWQAGRGLVV